MRRSVFPDRYSLFFICLISTCVLCCVAVATGRDYSYEKQLIEKLATRKAPPPGQDLTWKRPASVPVPAAASVADVYHPTEPLKFQGLFTRSIPLGPIGGEGQLFAGTPYLKITALQPQAPGDTGGLEVGDVIVGANDQLFELWDQNVSSGGKGPPKALGNAIEASEADPQRGGRIYLRILRGLELKTVRLELPCLGPLGPNWPAHSDKSDKFLSGICRYLAKTQGVNGRWRTGYGNDADLVSSAIGCLALLGSGDAQYTPNVKRLANRLIAMGPGGGADYGSWTLFYCGIFLCEYNLATGDGRALPVIYGWANELTTRMNPDTGRFGHGKLPVTYNGSGLNVVGTGILWFWSLAEQCGWLIPPDVWAKAEQHIRNCTAGNGGIGYSFRSGDHQGHARTGHMLLAMSIRDKDPAYQRRMAGFFITQINSMRENHAYSAPGVMAAMVSLARTSPRIFRQVADAWTWYFDLARQPDFSAAYIGGKENNSGDTYLNPPVIMNGCLGVILASSRKTLFIYGGMPRIPGIVYGQLPPTMQEIYKQINDTNYRTAATTLQNMVANQTPNSLAVKAMLDYINTLADHDFQQIVAAREAGDLLRAQQMLNALTKRFGRLDAHAEWVDAFNKQLREPESQHILAAGHVYDSLSDKLEREPSRADALLQEFITQFGDTYYARQARRKLQERHNATFTPQLKPLGGV